MPTSSDESRPSGPPSAAAPSGAMVRLLLLEAFSAGCLASFVVQYARHVPNTFARTFWQAFIREGHVYLWWSLIPFYVLQLPVLTALLWTGACVLRAFRASGPVGASLLIVSGASSSVLPIAAIHAQATEIDWSWSAVFVGGGCWAGARCAAWYRGSRVPQ